MALGVLFLVLICRSLVIVCFPESELALWLECRLPLFEHNSGESCDSSDGGGDGGGGD